MSINSKLRPSALRSVMWAGMESIFALMISIGSVLGIARLVGVDEFGLGSLAYGFVQIPLVIVGSLVHDAIVQRAELTLQHRSSAWIGSLCAGACSTLLVLVVSPFMGWVFNEVRLTQLMCALAPLVLLESINAPLLAERRRALDFGGSARRLLAARVVGMLAGLLSAWLGYGAWSIVAQQLVLSSASTILLLRGTTCMFYTDFSWSCLRDLLVFTRPIIATVTIYFGSERIFLSYIGYTLSMSAAGHWSLASRLVDTVVTTVLTALYYVGLAHFSLLQNDRVQLKEQLDNWQRWMMLGATVFIAVALVTSDQIIVTAVGSDWIDAVPAVQLLFIGALLQLRRQLPQTAVTALGQPHIALQAYLWENAVVVPILFIVVPETVTGVAVVRLLRAIAGYTVVCINAQRQRLIAWRWDLPWLLANTAFLFAGFGAGFLTREITVAAEMPVLVRVLSEAVVAASVVVCATFILQPRLAGELWAQRRRVSEWWSTKARGC